MKTKMLKVTEIPESEWSKLRPALEQAALLTIEQIHENVLFPFLRFHPVLAPYLRSLPGADDVALRERYVQRYYAVANYLYQEDDRNPQAVRALVWLELPNLRRALELLLEAGELDDASDIADSIARFLNILGLRRELEELRQRVGKAVTAANSQNDGKLTRAEWLREYGLGEDELQKGNLRTAYTRFVKLLGRIEALPPGTPFSHESYNHCLVLYNLARCLEDGGQPAAAEGRLREAMVVIEALIKQHPENQGFIRQRGNVLNSVGDVLRKQGKYQSAREAYEEALSVFKEQGDLRSQSVVLEMLGTLALTQREYTKAHSSYMMVLKIDHTLNEPRMEAVVLHQLGRVAHEQKNWAEAERCYRESLEIEERLGNAVGAAMTCNQLAAISKSAGRPTEAEGWYKRALELDELVQPGSLLNANHFSNLAALLLNEVRAGHIPKLRLAEVRKYAEQALAIRETLDASSEMWTTLGILADIADLEGHTEEARNYRRRERETYAAFEGNRYHIDRQHGQFIADIVAAARGDMQARAKVEAALPTYEAKGWHIANATRRTWAGERDWDSLVEDLDGSDGLLILRVLETIAQPEEAQG